MVLIGQYPSFPRVTSCVVEMNATQIVVRCDENAHERYEGRDLGGGHYVFDALELEGKRSLHRAPDYPILQGIWFDSATRGMWRIELKT